MQSFLRSVAFAFALMVPAYAGLPVGASAPDFTSQATLAGQPFDFTLVKALKKGPVVLYFYPKAFTRGCTYEAQEFAKATDDFAKLGATVVGVSNDKIEVLDKFSVEECASKFTVVSDTDGKVIRAYDAKLADSDNADRISYVIAPDGAGAKILMVYADMDPDKHVGKAMQAVKAWHAAHS